MQKKSLKLCLLKKKSHKKSIKIAKKTKSLKKIKIKKIKIT
jgi:hypothetical protein